MKRKEKDNTKCLLLRRRREKEWALYNLVGLMDLNILGVQIIFIIFLAHHCNIINRKLITMIAGKAYQDAGLWQGPSQSFRNYGNLHNFFMDFDQILHNLVRRKYFWWSLPSKSKLRLLEFLLEIYACYFASKLSFTRQKLRHIYWVNLYVKIRLLFCSIIT